MKVNFTKNCKLTIYKWKCINIFPTLSLMDVCADDAPFQVVSRLIELTLFGIVFDFLYPTSKERKSFISEVRGPLYSRNKKHWFYPTKY